MSLHFFFFLTYLLWGCQDLLHFFFFLLFREVEESAILIALIIVDSIFIRSLQGKCSEYCESNMVILSIGL